MKIYIIFSILFYSILSNTSEGSIKLPRVGIYIPAFESSDSLGKNTSAILTLKLWKTLRKAPTPNPNKLDFGKGKILWDDTVLNIQNHIDAERAAVENFSKATVWGKSWHYGNGAIIQPYLTIPKNTYNFSSQKLKVYLPCGDFKNTLTVDFPSYRYEFSPIPLPKGVLLKYGDLSKIPIYKKKKAIKKNIISFIGESFTALSHDGDYTKISSEGVTGWVFLPEIKELSSELIDFSGGIIRLFREDWSGAIDLLENVIKNPATSSAIKIDSYLYLTIAKLKLNKNPIDEINKAYLLNEYSKNTIKYMIMNKLIYMEKSTNHNEKKRTVFELLEIISSKETLFSKKNLWLKEIKHTLQCLKLNY